MLRWPGEATPGGLGQGAGLDFLAGLVEGPGRRGGQGRGLIHSPGPEAEKGLGWRVALRV